MNFDRWFVIINPTSGNGSSKTHWPIIKHLLKTYNFDFDFVFTEHESHSILIVQDAINQCFRKFISVGGDGTLHNIVNGIMSQDLVPSTEIKVGIIPIGTGNDWVKTHHIPIDFESAIQIIKNGNVKHQDLGKIEFPDKSQPNVYFNNLAGVGFDGYVVSKVSKYKHFGSIAYVLGAISGLFSFQKFISDISVNDDHYKTQSLMILVGLCKYSGGGMQLTKKPDPFDGLLDISVAKDIGKLDVIKNLPNLFNGKIVNHKKVDCFKSKSITIVTQPNDFAFIQADGELIGKGGFRINVISSAFSFYAK